MNAKPLSLLQLEILRVLARPKSGKGIAAALRSMTGRDYPYSSIYLQLQRLEGKGYLEVSARDPEASGDKRMRRFVITAAGKRAANESCTAYRELLAVNESLLAELGP